MKYPILTIKSIPKNYKHCGIYQAAFFKFDNEELFLSKEDSDLRKQYLRETKFAIVEAIDNNFITSQSTNVFYENQYFVLFKSNLDVKAYELFIVNLLKEVKDYVDCDMKFYYGLTQVMLFEEGKDFGIFSSTRAGTPLNESEQIKKAYKEVDTTNTKGHAKYLTSFEEYKQQNAAKGDYYSI